MNRAGENFALDGQGMARKFQKLTMLLKHYDSKFYSYLVEHQAEELIFCYRWMLLDLKREFPFESALQMLEVLWASIPPNACAYQNLFDEGFVYVPNTIPHETQNIRERSATQQLSEIISGASKLNIKPNILDSPVSDEECLNAKPNFVHPKPWNSPNHRREVLTTEPGIEIGKPLMELYFCCSENFDESENDKIKPNSKKSHSVTSKTTKSDDGISSCSTFDSGIQRSNTLSNESVKSLKISGNKKYNEFSMKTSFVTAVHCNGDYSDDDDHISGMNLNVIDECFVAEEDVLQKMIDEDAKVVEQRRTMYQHHHSPMINRLLTVGQSFDYETSTNPLTDSIETILHQESDAYASETMLSKSISEEVLNRVELQDHDNKTEHDDYDNDEGNEFDDKNKLHVHSTDDLDCLSSSSTSSLVILNKSCKLSENVSNAPQTTLLSPAQLGSDDAFMLFMCLTILLQHGDKIMQNRMDSNDIQLYFDNMIRKHNVKSVLSDARNLFHTYLSQWHNECFP